MFQPKAKPIFFFPGHVLASQSLAVTAEGASVPAALRVRRRRASVRQEGANTEGCKPAKEELKWVTMERQQSPRSTEPIEAIRRQIHRGLLPLRQLRDMPPPNSTIPVSQ